MSNGDQSARAWGLGAGGLGIGFILGSALAWQGAAPAPPVNPQLRTLDADLWVQTAGEYRACCLQAYRLATDRLREKLKAKAEDGKPPAVILDLDETAIGNPGYQTFLYRAGQDYSDASWKEWEKKYAGEVELVPGARGFIAAAQKAGVKVFYISNRTGSRPSTCGRRR
jgi:5'-nucleotidase (lipoprotein e(P4) family)